MQSEFAASQSETEATLVEAETKQEDSGAKLANSDAKQADAKAAWENPLIPNARLRAICHAMTLVRTLEKSLPAAKRARTIGLGAKRETTVGLEACLVSTAADLGPGDLVSDALAGGTLEFLRGTALSEILQSGNAVGPGKRRKRVRSTAGEYGAAGQLPTAAGRLPGAADATERIWAALGAAAALKTAAARARAEDKTEDSVEGGTARQAGVVVVYVMAGELSDLLWKRILRFSVDHELPVIFIVLQKVQGRDDKVRTASVGGVNALALHCGVPAIVVDSDDAVAIYRVAQESIGHARIGGGAALIECVPFVLKEVAGKSGVKTDAIAGLEQTLVQRGVATRAWMVREAKLFAKRLAR
jgi:TPP-dependent pyruvate/acetoin dehydrogenase alpha subunit